MHKESRGNPAFFLPLRQEHEIAVMRKNRSYGFTLIELLVVIAIIGILAAIAIPQFSRYRQKGYDAQALSDLRNGASAEELYYSMNQVFITCATAGACQAALPGLRISNGTVLSFTSVGTNFTGTSTHPLGTGTTYNWDSLLGGLQ